MFLNTYLYYQHRFLNVAWKDMGKNLHGSRKKTETNFFMFVAVANVYLFLSFQRLENIHTYVFSFSLS